jgi:hypothetical protein
MLIKELGGDFLTDTIKICDLFGIKILIEGRVKERGVHGVVGVGRQWCAVDGMMDPRDRAPQPPLCHL